MLRHVGGSLALFLLAVLLTACTAGEDDKDPAGSSKPEPVPELTREWEMSSLSTIPLSSNEHYWVSDGSVPHVDAGFFEPIPAIKMFDAQSGQPLMLDLGGFDCGVPTLHPGDTHFVVATSDTEPGDYNDSKAAYHSPTAFTARECTGLAVYDAATGEKAWEWPLGTARPIAEAGINGDAVIVSYVRGEHDCLDKEDGSPLSISDEDCSAVPLESDDQTGSVQLDGVVLAAGQSNGAPMARAYDLETSETLWVDSLDPDPAPSPGWDRAETYAATSDSLLRIRYEFEEQEGEDSRPRPTFAFISRVDPRTGEELGPVGKVAGGLFLAQVGDITVMAVDQEAGFNSQLAGFRVPATE